MVHVKDSGKDYILELEIATLASYTKIGGIQFAETLSA